MLIKKFSYFNYFNCDYLSRLNLILLKYDLVLLNYISMEFILLRNKIRLILIVNCCFIQTIKLNVF